MAGRVYLVLLLPLVAAVPFKVLSLNINDDGEIPLVTVPDKQVSVYYNATSGSLRVDQYDASRVKDAVAWANFTNQINATGWSYLEVHSNVKFSDSLQAYAAGVAEAYATKDLIRMHRNNVIGDYCKNRKAYCKSLESFLNKNLKFVVSNVIEKRESSSYWHQIGLVLEQLVGIQDVVTGASALRPNSNVSVLGFIYLFNIMGDVEDLEAILNDTSKVKVRGSGSCSALIKLLPNNADIFAAQDTWNDYGSMLRILKHYDLPFHKTQEANELIPGIKASFSSYPGTLQSGDDFYVLSSGLVTLETTIGNGNPSLYQRVKPDKIVLEFIRSIVANRLAVTGQEWARIFSQFNSGTYNNQWMVVDYKLFYPGKPLQPNLLIVLEQLPTYIRYEDLTHVLEKQRYWPSYNTPYFKTVFNMSGQPEMVAKYGDWFTYERTPRALIFKRDHTNVVDIPSMIHLMRYNDFTHDPLSSCNCTPPYSGENTIAARSDLNPANGSYPFSALGHRNHGATDMKMTTSQLRKDLTFIAVGGPPHENVPPFVWSKSDYQNVSHEGQPDVWVFPPVLMRFFKLHY